MRRNAAYLLLFLVVTRYALATDFADVISVAENANRLPGAQWTPSVSVGVRYFLTRDSNQWLTKTEGDRGIKVSPDSKRFFTISFYGSIECGCNIYDLDVYSVEAIRASIVAGEESDGVKPISHVSMRTMRGTAAIRNAKWDGGSGEISFYGTDSKDRTQIFILDIDSNKLKQLTKSASGVQVAHRFGRTVIYSTYVPEKGKGVEYHYPIHTITSRDLREATIPDLGSRVFKTYVATSQGSEWLLNSDYVPFSEPAFSPDGSKAVLVRAPRVVPSSWAAYDGTSADGTVYKQPMVPAEFPQFVLVDFKRRRSEPLMEAPTGAATRMGEKRLPDNSPEMRVPHRALWSRDGQRVVLVNAALPIEGSQPTSEITSAAYILVYELSSKRWEILEPIEEVNKADGATRRVTSVTWGSDGRELIVSHEASGQVSSTAYDFSTSGISKRKVVINLDPVHIEGTEHSRKLAANSHDIDGLRISLEQDANRPPEVVATIGKRTLRVTSHDPTLQGIWRAPVQKVTWLEAGKPESGGLMLPRGFDARNPPPMVIQAYYNLPNLFRPDGSHFAAFAAQSLAARGMAVLMVDIPVELIRTKSELVVFRRRVDAAVKHLAEGKLIDPLRIGLIGFSRSGFLTYNAITHPGDTKLKAAIIDDSWSGTYFSYLLTTATLGLESAAEFEDVYGGKFWAVKGDWLKSENGFNVDQVKTPAMFTIHNRADLINVIETFALFNLNKKPMELLMFPRGQHQLTVPQERVASMMATVDWMSFWLQNYEDPAPEKRAQYQRWRAMREMTDAPLAGAAEEPG